MTALQALLLSMIHLAYHIPGFYTEHPSLMNNGILLLHSCQAESVTSCRLATKYYNKDYKWECHLYTGSSLEMPCSNKCSSTKCVTSLLWKLQLNYPHPHFRNGMNLNDNSISAAPLLFHPLWFHNVLYNKNMLLRRLMSPTHKESLFEFTELCLIQL